MNIIFNGARVLVTGGSRGIGRAIALGFARSGARVAITYEKDQKSALEAVQELRSAGSEPLALQLDLRSEEAVDQALGEMVATFGGIDILVCNAGIWEEGRVDELSLEDFKRTMEINMGGTFLATKYAARSMKTAGGGSIVIISSTAGQRGEAEHSHYAASKGAQISFTKSLASELAPYGIRVNCVAPGWVATEMTRSTLQDPREQQKVLQSIPLRRVAEPSEIANAVLFIASDAASFITGEILNVNGGAVLCG